MSKKMFTDEQIVRILEEGERTEESKAEGLSQSWLSRERMVSLN
jgi:hypothetical protein